MVHTSRTSSAGVCIDGISVVHRQSERDTSHELCRILYRVSYLILLLIVTIWSVIPRLADGRRALILWPKFSRNCYCCILFRTCLRQVDQLVRVGRNSGSPYLPSVCHSSTSTLRTMSSAGTGTPMVAAPRTLEGRPVSQPTLSAAVLAPVFFGGTIVYPGAARRN